MEEHFAVTLAREIDHRALTDLGLPSLLLMENAARSAAEVMLGDLGFCRDDVAVIVTGTGNNAGDGFALARHILARLDAPVFIVAMIPPDAFAAGSDVSVMANICRRASIPIEAVGRGDLPGPPGRRIIVDALLGTGIRLPLREPVRSVARAINRSGDRILALDIPTGLDGDTGEADPDAVRATATVTFGVRKRGLVLRDGPRHAGRVFLGDLGLPRSFVRSVVRRSDAD